MDNKDRVDMNGYDGVILLEDYDYGDALIGITHDNRAVYDYAMMVNYLTTNYDFTEDEADDWICSNVVRDIEYKRCEESPIIMFPLY